MARAFLSWTYSQQEYHCNQMRKFGRDAALAELLADAAAMKENAC
jgi:hypothetical protein